MEIIEQLILQTVCDVRIVRKTDFGLLRISYKLEMSGKLVLDTAY